MLCVGDSLTAGGYPRDLQDMLRSHISAEVKDFGVKGSSVIAAAGAAYGRLARLKPELERLQSPDIVVAMLGTNDAKAGCQNNKNTKLSTPKP